MCIRDRAEACRRRAEKNELSPEFISLFLEAIHQEGITQPERVMNDGVKSGIAPAGDLWIND